MIVEFNTDRGRISLNPAMVISVQPDFYEKYILVTTVDDTVHEVSRDFGESIGDAHRRVTTLLNGDPA